MAEYKPFKIGDQVRVVSHWGFASQAKEGMSGTVRDYYSYERYDDCVQVDFGISGMRSYICRLDMLELVNVDPNSFDYKLRSYIRAALDE